MPQLKDLGWYTRLNDVKYVVYLKLLISLEKRVWLDIRQDMVQRRQLEAQRTRAIVIVYVVETGKNLVGVNGHSDR